MHRDTRYKWKPIKGENHILLLLWCKGKLQLPLTTVFCRHQPTGGSILNYASYNLQGSSNSHQFSVGTNLQEAPTSVSYDWHFIKATTWCGSTNSHLFSAGTNLQEAPTSVSYNWHLSSYNLIGKLQLPYSFKRKTLADLPWISALFCTFFSVAHQLLYQTCMISALPFLLLCSAPPYSHSSCSLLIFFNYLQFCCTLSPLLILFSSTLLPLDIILFYTKIASWLFVFHWEFEMGSHVSLPSAFSSLFSSLRKM